MSSPPNQVHLTGAKEAIQKSHVPVEQKAHVQNKKQSFLFSRVAVWLSLQSGGLGKSNNRKNKPPKRRRPTRNDRAYSSSAPAATFSQSSETSHACCDDLVNWTEARAEYPPQRLLTVVLTFLLLLFFSFFFRTPRPVSATRTPILVSPAADASQSGSTCADHAFSFGSPPSIANDSRPISPRACPSFRF